MTTVPDTLAVGPHARPKKPRHGRVIAVGIRDHVYDATALAWAEADAIGGADAVHVVHAYVPLRLDGCTWDPVRRERDARGLLGKRITAQAVQRVRTARPDVPVDGSTIQGLPEDVLHEFSHVVDLLVIGDDSADTDKPRKIAWRVQDRAHCPVVSVPRKLAARTDEPVTVVLVDREHSEAALRFATDAADRHGVAVRVAHPEADDAWLARLAATSRLLVTSRSGAPLLRTGSAALPCPTAVVPQRHVTRS